MRLGSLLTNTSENSIVEHLKVLINRDIESHLFSLIALFRCGSRIWSRGGAPASEAESCRHSEAESHERSEYSAAGVQGPLKGPGSFWVFDAQICILTHSRDSFSLIFDIYFDTKS